MSGFNTNTPAAADNIFSGDGDDLVFANAGNDLVSGENGNDSLYGGTGNDTINGGSGDDLISGDEGNDVLIGFAGIDTFFLDMRTAGQSGNDSVSYFEDVIDIFKIDAASGTTFANLSVTASGTSTLVSFNGNSITITNTAPALIDASDFLFV